MTHLTTAALGAAILLMVGVPAKAQGTGDPVVAACVDQIIRRVPTWGAMIRFRQQMRTSGYTSTPGVRESDPRGGRSWTAYNVQIRGESQAYRIACEDR